MLRWPQSVHSKGKNVSLGDNDSSELEVKIATWLLWVACVSESTKKRVRVLAGMTDSDYQGDIGLPFHSGGKEAYTSGM